jgi:hypothetical protein
MNALKKGGSTAAGGHADGREGRGGEKVMMTKTIATI